MANKKTKIAIMAINSEREKVIDKLEEMLEFFRHAPIKNEDSLKIINEQLDDVMSSLKYVPCEPSFDCLPTEIKTDILNYLCDSEAFVAASVSQEWMRILEKNLKQVKKIHLGKHCSKCKDKECFMPKEFLKAAVTHNLDIPLFVCYPLRDIDTELIVKGITNVSNLSIKDDCWICKGYDGHKPSILAYQLEALFEELETQGKIMDNLQLFDVDLKNLNQTNLVNYRLNKVKKLALDEALTNGMLDIELLIKTLLQSSTDSQLSFLSLGYFNYRHLYPNSQQYPNLSVDFADAICKVQSVDLLYLAPTQEINIAKRIVKNIQTQNTRMKSFGLYEDIDWRDVLSPDELKEILEMMDELKLMGYFNEAQVEAAKSLPGVEANFHKISKCLV